VISLTFLGNFTGMERGRLEIEAGFLVSLPSLFFRILLILEVNFDVNLLLKDVLLLLCKEHSILNYKEKI